MRVKNSLQNMLLVRKASLKNGMLVTECCTMIVRCWSVIFINFCDVCLSVSNKEYLLHFSIIVTILFKHYHALKGKN